jgi:CheY-like chemotaxis protein
MPLEVLLIEDNPDDADLLREMLAEGRGARVSLTAVETLRDGIAHLEAAEPDLLLLDLSLPDSQGLQTVTRALAHAQRVPIIVLTGLDDDALGVRAIHAGAQDYLAKGQVDAPLLRRTMHYAIERHRLLAERTDDARVFAALARVGEALMAGLHTHTLLDRLCQVTAEVLACDVTSTWVLDEPADAYVPAAANTGEEWDRIAALRAPRDTLKPLTEARASKSAVHRLDERLRRRLPVPLVQMPDGVVAAACLTLRRGGEIAGMQVCGYRNGGGEWSSVQERIAQGLVHVVALALDNAQLVAELEQSNAIKTYFAATMSHELRNTVFAIGGFSEMVLEALRRPGKNDPVRLAQMIGERESAQIIGRVEMTRPRCAGAPDERALALHDLVEPLQHELIAVQRARARDRLGPGAGGSGSAHRCGEAAHGAQEPGDQRDQVQRGRRGAGDRGPRRRARATDGVGHGHRHPIRGAAAPLRAVPPGARTPLAARRRRRARSLHRAPSGRSARRHDRRGERPGARHDLRG